MPFVIDHVEQLSLSDDERRLRANELNALLYLAQGLAFLADQVKRIEDRYREQLDPKRVEFHFGNVPGFEWVPRGLLVCSFHWYAVSACNYARMVGWLANAGDTKKAAAYVQRVLPSVYLWRNKVAAHFAQTNPRLEDTAADLAASVMLPISFDDDAFAASALRISLKGTSSRTDMQWKLTHVHRDLVKRYWPTEGDASDRS